MQYLGKLTTRLLSYTTIPVYVVYTLQKEMLTSTNRMFIEVLFTISKTWKQLKCPITEWINKLIHLHDGILYGNAKTMLLLHARTWDDLQILC